MMTINNKFIENPILKVWVSSNEISIAKLKAHNKVDFKAFYKFYAPAIYGSVMRRVKNEAKCDLIVEQTFTQAWETIASYNDEECSLFTWLNRFAIKAEKKLNS